MEASLRRLSGLFLAASWIMIAPPVSAGAIPRSFPGEVERVSGAERTLDASDSGTWSSLPPPTQVGAATIVDPVRHRLLTFGRNTGTAITNEVWEMPLDGGGGWTQVVTVGSAPTARSGTAAIYDPSGDRMVIFGGRDTSPRNDVWTLSLSGTPTWTPISPEGTLPPPRYLHAATYDPTHHRMLVFAGTRDFLQSLDFNDVWALPLTGPPHWINLSSLGGGPAPREAPSVIYDPVRDRMVVFAGATSGGYLFDVWALSLSGAPSWTSIVPGGQQPCPRWAHGAVYDSIGDRMIVFGGESFTSSECSGIFNDLWALPLSQTIPVWEQRVPIGSLPRPRSFAGVAYDPVGARLLMTGGRGYDPGAVHPVFYQFNDTWALPLTGRLDWFPLASGPAPEAGRGGHTIAYDEWRERVLVFGGSDGAFALGDLWELPLVFHPIVAPVASRSRVATATWPWSPLLQGGEPPPSLVDAAAAMDSTLASMLLVGGFGTSYENRVWRLSVASNPPTWTLVNVVGTPPAGRAGHSLVLDRSRNRLLLFGGQGDGSTLFDDVWECTLGGTPAWNAIAASGSRPSARFGHSAIYDSERDRMLVFGGTDATGQKLSDLWELSFSSTPTWSPLSPAGPPPAARSGHAAVWDLARDRMVISGGSLSSGFPAADVHALNLSSLAWYPLAPDGPVPARRTDHVAIYDPARDRMLIYGGYGLDDTSILGWGRPTAPRVVAVGDTPWQAGASLPVRFAVTNRLAVTVTYGWLCAGSRHWPGLPIEGAIRIAGGQTDTVRLDVVVPDSAAAGIQDLRLDVRCSASPSLAAGAVRHLHDASTPLVALASMHAAFDAVDLQWRSPVAAGQAATVTRRDADGGSISSPVAFGNDGGLDFVDRAVVPGARYTYQLDLAPDDGGGSSAPVEVEIPPRPVLALRGARPNPGAGPISVELSLPPGAGAARLEVLDVGGRRIAWREVGDLGPGSHVVTLRETGTARAGVYLLRLSSRARTESARVVVLK